MFPRSVTMSVAGKQRARSFTSEEKTLLLQLANAEKAYLKGRFGPTITKKGKQGKWKHIAQELNGMNGYGDRTGDDCLKKYDNMVNEIKKQERDRMKYRKATGGETARSDVIAACVVFHNYCRNRRIHDPEILPHILQDIREEQAEQYTFQITYDLTD